MSMSSSFIRRMFNAQLILTDGGNKRKEEITLFLPNYQKEMIKFLIEFLSTGELRQAKVTKTFIDDFEQLWEDLKLDTISFKDAFDAGKTLLPLSATDKNKKPPPGPRNESITNKSGLRASPKPQRRILPAAASSPLSGRTYLQKRSFISGNSSLLPNPPKFSSTPLRQDKPKRATIKPNPLPTVAENLANNPQISVIDKPDGDQSKFEATADADDIMVVGEVKKKESYSFPIKHELPAGISITKQVSKEVSKDNKTEEKGDPIDVGIIHDTASVALKGKEESRKEEEKVSLKKKTSHSSKLAKTKLKRAKSVGRRPLNSSSASVSSSSSATAGRRTSSRRTISATPTYNEDLIQKKVFEKSSISSKPGPKMKKPIPGPNLSESFQKNIVLKTKNLKIPLTNVKDRKLEAIKQKKDQADVARARVETRRSSARSNGAATPTPAQAKTVITTIPAAVMKKIDPDEEPIACYICHQTKDEKGRTLCLRSANVLRSHVSLCLYGTGKLFKSIPPGKDNTDAEGKPIDEMTKKYACEVDGCWLNAKRGRSGQVGYKEHAIHMSSQHGGLEMVLVEEGKEALNLMDKLMEHDGAKNSSILKGEDIPMATLSEDVFLVKDEAVQGNDLDVVDLPNKSTIPVTSSTMLEKPSSLVCFICKQKVNLKNPNQIREHYAKCLYDEKKFVEFVPPGSDNNGSDFDETKVIYKCSIQGCWLQKNGKKVNYRVYAQHMAGQHGIVEKILEADPRPQLKTILNRLKESVSSSSDLTLPCRIPGCETKFKGDSKREMKLHYASKHFSDFFVVDANTGLPDNFTKTSGNRTMCNACSNSAPKPVYIQSEKEAMRGHLVVKHDIMFEILPQASDKGITEAGQVFRDIYGISS